MATTESIKIALTKPVAGPDGEITELTFREPTGADIERHGNPVHIRAAGTDDAFASYVEALRKPVQAGLKGGLGTLTRVTDAGTSSLLGLSMQALSLTSVIGGLGAATKAFASQSRDLDAGRTYPPANRRLRHRRRNRDEKTRHRPRS